MSSQSNAMRDVLASKTTPVRSNLKTSERPSWLETEPIQVDPKLVDFNPKNDYPKRTGKALDEFVESLKKNGVLIAIFVKPGKKGRYQLIAGEDRTRAAQIAGLSSIPANLVLNKNLTAAQEKEIMRIENEERKPMKAHEKEKFVEEEFGEEIRQDNRGKKGKGKNIAKRIAAASRGQISEASAKRIVAKKRKDAGVPKKKVPKLKISPAAQKKFRASKLKSELKMWEQGLKTAETKVAEAKKRINEIKKELQKLK